jgi:heme/copper-type cytochrome/quinol oxidase subunit 2
MFIHIYVHINMIKQWYYHHYQHQHHDYCYSYNHRHHYHVSIIIIIITITIYIYLYIEIPDVQFHENGYLYLASEKGKKALEKNNSIQKECGVDWMDLHTPGAYILLSNENNCDLMIFSMSDGDDDYDDKYIFFVPIMVVTIIMMNILVVTMRETSKMTKVD